MLHSDLLLLRCTVGLNVAAVVGAGHCRLQGQGSLRDDTILDDQGCESLEELLLEDDWRAAVDVRVYEVCQLRRASLLGDNALSDVFCEALRLNRPGRNAKTLCDLREEVQRLLQRYALEDIDSWSPRLRCFVLEEPSLLNWVYKSCLFPPPSSSSFSSPSSPWIHPGGAQDFKISQPEIEHNSRHNTHLLTENDSLTWIMQFVFDN